jgi:hypothetical protein
MDREQQRISRSLRRGLVLGGALALAFTGPGAAFASTTNPIAAAEWALNTLNVTAVRQQFAAHGAGVTVAVIDTGVDPNQPDLKGRLIDGVNLIIRSSPTSITPTPIANPTAHRWRLSLPATRIWAAAETTTG